MQSEYWCYAVRTKPLKSVIKIKASKQISNWTITKTIWIFENSPGSILEFYLVYNHFHLRFLRPILWKFRVAIFGQFCLKLEIFPIIWHKGKTGLRRHLWKTEITKTNLDSNSISFAVVNTFHSIHLSYSKENRQQPVKSALDRANTTTGHRQKQFWRWTNSKKVLDFSITTQNFSHQKIIYCPTSYTTDTPGRVKLNWRSMAPIRPLAIEQKKQFYPTTNLWASSILLSFRLRCFRIKFKNSKLSYSTETLGQQWITYRGMEPLRSLVSEKKFQNKEIGKNVYNKIILQSQNISREKAQPTNARNASQHKLGEEVADPAKDRRKFTTS